MRVHGAIDFMTAVVNHTTTQPERFIGDLIRDGYELANMPESEPFVWWVTQDGTHLTRTLVHYAGVRGYHDHMKAFLWDGKNFTELEDTTAYPECMALYNLAKDVQAHQRRVGE